MKYYKLSEAELLNLFSNCDCEDIFTDPLCVGDVWKDKDCTACYLHNLRKDFKEIKE